MTKKQSITVIDWLQVRFNVELPTFSNNKKYFKLNNETFILYTGNQSQNFSNVDDLYIKGEKVGTLQYNPRSTIIKDSIIILKIENELFYNETYLKYVDYCISVLKWKYEGITRIDIARDCINYDLIPFVKTHYHSTELRLPTYSIKKVGKTKLYPYDETMYLGSKSSGKHIKIYDKSKELKNNNKRHIKAFYRLNGMDWKSNTVERFELSLNGKKAKNINVFALTNHNYLNDILRQESKGFFEFTKTVIRKGKKKIKDVTPIKFNDVTPTEYNKVTQKKVYTLNSLGTAKRLIKSLYFDNLEHKDVTYLDNQTMIYRLVSKNDLWDWYNTKQDYWLNEFNRKTANDVISLMVEQQLSECIANNNLEGIEKILNEYE